MSEKNKRPPPIPPPPKPSYLQTSAILKSSSASTRSTRSNPLSSNSCNTIADSSISDRASRQSLPSSNVNRLTKVFEQQMEQMIDNNHLVLAVPSKKWKLNSSQSQNSSKFSLSNTPKESSDINETQLNSTKESSDMNETRLNFNDIRARFRNITESEENLSNNQDSFKSISKSRKFPLPPPPKPPNLRSLVISYPNEIDQDQDDLGDDVPGHSRGTSPTTVTSEVSSLDESLIHPLKIAPKPPISRISKRETTGEKLISRNISNQITGESNIINSNEFSQRRLNIAQSLNTIGIVRIGSPLPNSLSNNSSHRSSHRSPHRPPPRSSPRSPPRSPPRSSPRSPPRSPPRSSPRSPPRSSPRSPPRSSPRSPPRSSPRSPPRSSPRSPPPLPKPQKRDNLENQKINENSQIHPIHPIRPIRLSRPQSIRRVSAESLTQVPNLSVFDKSHLTVTNSRLSRTFSSGSLLAHNDYKESWNDQAENSNQVSCDINKKRLIKRRNLLNELYITEVSYYNDMALLENVYLKNAKIYEIFNKDDLRIIFGNLSDIVIFSGKLKDLFKQAIGEEILKIDQSNISLDQLEKSDHTTFIGQVFIEYMNELQITYAEYCKRHEISVIHLEELEKSNSKVASFLIESKKTLHNQTTAWDLNSLLIKPVQRVLKYPLLLKHITEETNPDHSDFKNLSLSVKEIINVADHINEIKKRKDIVEKIVGSRKKQDINIGHGITKSLTRGSEKLMQTVGLKEGTRDLIYDNLLEKFQFLENQCHEFIQDINNWVKFVKEFFQHQKILGETLVEFYTNLSKSQEKKIQEYYHLISEFGNTIQIQLEKEIKNIIFQIHIETLLELFKNPAQVMAKREKKLLDYDRCRAIEERGDQPDKNLKISANIYLSLNAQLIDELPKFFSLICKYMDAIINSFAIIQGNFYKEMRNQYNEFYKIWINDDFGKQDNIIKIWKDQFQLIDIQFSEFSCLQNTNILYGGFDQSDSNSNSKSEVESASLNDNILKKTIGNEKDSLSLESRSRSRIDQNSDFSFHRQSNPFDDKQRLSLVYDSIPLNEFESNHVQDVRRSLCIFIAASIYPCGHHIQGEDINDIEGFKFIPFESGQLLQVYREDNSHGLWFGKLENGAVGWVDSNYFVRIE